MQFLLLGDQRFVSIFDRVLIPPVFEHLGYLSPLLTLIPDMRDKDVVLPEFPLLFGFVGIEVIEPPFPALLRRAEKLAFRSNIKFLGQLAPLVLLPSVAE